MKMVMVLVVCSTFMTVQAMPLFQGQDGLVVMEAESTSSPLGKWEQKQSVPGYTGAGHLEFTGNKPTGGRALCPLTYAFTVDRDGLYHFWVRGYKRLQGDDGQKQKNDQCNDCYVRLRGDYQPGFDVPRSVLENDNKLFVSGNSASEWGWTKYLQFEHPETKKKSGGQPQYKLKKGATYTLTISGRSQRFNMDRIVLMHDARKPDQAQDPNTPESLSVPVVTVFQGQDGVVTMESESTSSDLDQWVVQRSVKGYTGDSHLEFTGNNPNMGPASSPLTYRFTVDKAGVYHFWMRAHKRLEDKEGNRAREDQCNDCFVRLEGAYEAGGQAPLAVLRKDTKIYVQGQSSKTWDWTAKLDFHDPNANKDVKKDPLYKLKAGVLYTLTVSGRSQRFNMDRLVFIHQSQDAAAIKAALPAQSKAVLQKP